eukprot:4559449-Prymnesium_polylepis.1
MSCAEPVLLAARECTPWLPPLVQLPPPRARRPQPPSLLLRLPPAWTLPLVHSRSPAPPVRSRGAPRRGSSLAARRPAAAAALSRAPPPAAAAARPRSTRA